MLADFVRKTKTALAKTDVSSRHIAVSAPHQHTHTHTHTHTHSVQYPHKTVYRKQHVRYTGLSKKMDGV